MAHYHANCRFAVKQPATTEQEASWFRLKQAKSKHGERKFMTFHGISRELYLNSHKLNL